MSYSDLLNRMRERDTEAFLEMTDRYGWSLYASIRKKYPDKDVADRVYNETMNAFYRALQNPDCDDPVEALLCAFSDKISIPSHSVVRNHLQLAEESGSVEPPEIRISDETVSHEEHHEHKTRKKSGFLTTVGLILVSVGIFFTLWVILGLLMALDVIPAADLGYSWFNANIARWF